MAPYSLVGEFNIMDAHMASYCLHLQDLTCTLRMETAYYAQALSCFSQILNDFVLEVIMDLWGGSKLNRLGTFTILLTLGKIARWMFSFVLFKIYRDFLYFHLCNVVVGQHSRVRLAVEWVHFMVWGTFWRQEPHLETYAAFSCYEETRSVESHICFLKKKMRFECLASG
jgi:hypothetical protein